VNGSGAHSIITRFLLSEAGRLMRFFNSLQSIPNRVLVDTQTEVE